MLPSLPHRSQRGSKGPGSQEEGGHSCLAIPPGSPGGTANVLGLAIGSMPLSQMGCTHLNFSFGFIAKMEKCVINLPCSNSNSKDLKQMQ